MLFFYYQTCDHNFLFRSEGEAFEHSGSNLEIEAISEEGNNDDNTLALARHQFRVQQNGSPPPPFTEALNIKKSFVLFIDDQCIVNYTNIYAKSHVRYRYKTSWYATNP